MNDQQIIFEHWGVPYGYEERYIAAQRPEDLQQLIHAMLPESSAVLYVEDAEERRLSIYASDSLFSVNFQEDETTSFDLVGDATATDGIPFVQGGQLVTIPRRYVVSEARACQVAIDFFRTGTLALDAGWDRYVPGTHWTFT